MISRTNGLSSFFDARTALLAVAVSLATVACDRGALLAPTNSRISLTASSRVVPLNGTTELQATVLENSGSPVPNGTSVRFTTSLGRVDPVEAKTQNGVAVTTFHAGTESGVAQVTAISGLASGSTTTTGTGGTTGGTTTTAANVVDITIGAAAVRSIALSSNPGTLRPSGSTVEISAFVSDANGNPVRSVPVTFTTTRGTITPALVPTDTEGVARTALTGSENTTVTARVSGAGTAPPPSGTTTPPADARSATIEIRTSTVPSFTLATSPTNPSAGQPVILTISPAGTGGGTGTGGGAATTAPAVTVNWGDGDSDDIGVVSAIRSVTHTYDAPGFYTITAIGRQEGETFSNSTAVTVAQRPPVQLRVDQAIKPVGSPFNFTITPTTGALIQRIVINYGDNTEDDLGAISSETTRQHAYATQGPRTVTVTQTETNGNVTRATVTVSVSP